VFAAAVVTSNTGAVGVDLWGAHISNLSLGGVFVAGLATGVLALLGLVMLFAGMRRAQRLRRERRALAKENARLVQHAGSTEPVAEPVWPAQQRTEGEPTAAPVHRSEAPAHDAAPGYGTPPPPSYDRATIESERDRAAEDGYEPATAGQSAPDEVSRRQR
jgi:hypothetical protein